jgi:hypothetical protein
MNLENVIFFSSLLMTENLKFTFIYLFIYIYIYFLFFGDILPV